MQIAVCDDEPNVRILIKNMILTSEPSAEITEFDNGQELEISDVFQYDIIFMDVEMNHQSGVETARNIREKQQKKNISIWGSFPLIIFITGYSEYMPDAFSCNAFGYLVKPVKQADFDKCFSRAVAECGKQKAQNEKYIIIKVGTSSKKIYENDIKYVESEKRKNIIHLKDEELAYYGLISDLENELSKDFFRIHKGFLVNMKYVDRYNRTQVFLRSGESLLLSKYRYADFVSAYMESLKDS
jgi:two-component system LytT family response regulator/two-component system response regulator LytT